MCFLWCFFSEFLSCGSCRVFMLVFKRVVFHFFNVLSTFFISTIFLINLCLFAFLVLLFRAILNYNFCLLFKIERQKLLRY